MRKMEKMTNKEFIDELKNSKTDHAIVDRLKKAGRKFDICDNWRRAILYCKGCGEKLGEFDLIYESHESHLYCNECAEKYKKPVPYDIKGLERSKVVKDCGTFVKVYYDEPMCYEIKNCYFTKKGRYIKYHGKRWYL